MNSVSEQGSDFIQDLDEAVRKNPLSAALIGMGVLWLFTGSRPVETASDFIRNANLDRIPHAAGNAFEGAAREGAVDALDNVTRYGRDYADRASEHVTSIPGTSAEIFDTVRSNLLDVFRGQPLALGAVGIAIGAGIAAALPATQLETDYLGETSDTVKAKAVELAAEQTSRVTMAAEKVVDAVTEEARKQDLTLESAKSATCDISAKLGRVVDAAGKGISERVTSSKS
jgi:hypothetical protein